MSQTRDNSERTKEFKKNEHLELLLNELNSDLWIAEQSLLGKRKQDLPIVFIVGPLRSGTTLMTQWLANTGSFSYPTNMLSRFYHAPIIGAKIQKLLTDKKYNFRDEILDFSSKVYFKSENGKTKGALSPNEFWYFWRRFIKFQDIDYLPDHELLQNVDIETFRNELLGVADVFEKPFALKALICNYNIGFLNAVFDKAVFIYTKRNPYTNIESVLKARERQYGSEKHWYSFKIPEYHELIKIEDPITQTAGQIYYINRAVESGLEEVDDHKKLIVPYEDFCNHPHKYYAELYKKLKAQGYEIDNEYHGPESFDISRSEVSNPRIVAAYDEFEKSGA